MKKEESLEQEIKEIAEEFLGKSKERGIQIISHFDTDGITSVTIMIQALKKIDRTFSVKIVKSLEEQFIFDLPKDKIILFLDLASGSLNHIAEAGLKDVFIIDHHEIIQQIPENVRIINPELNSKQKISSSCLTYLFCKEIDEENRKFAKLAVLGMIGDTLEKNIERLDNGILEDGEIKKKRGLTIYPSTRPLNRTLEFCSDPYIPEVTGNPAGVLELLRETGLNSANGKCKSLMELNEEEMKKLITAIMLRNPKTKNKDIIGDIFLIKFFNKLEDARELSAKINACSRFGESGTAIQFCMEIPNIKEKVESIHARYRQELLSAIKFAFASTSIKGRGFLIINAKNNIRDTMIGTIASILSKSSLYEEGTLVTLLAYYEDKIKISARIVGEKGRNAREILNSIIEKIGGEAGGHQFAAGCIISREKEKEFIDLLKKILR